MKTKIKPALIVTFSASLFFYNAIGQQKIDSALYGKVVPLHSYNLEAIRTKEVSQEIDMAKNLGTYIFNNQRSMIIRTWDEPKVKITTTVYYKGESTLTDMEWFERLGLVLKTWKNLVDVRSDYKTSKYFNVKNKGHENGYYAGSMVLFDGTGENIGSIENTRRVITVYVPRRGKLKLKTRLTDLHLVSDFAEVEATISLGSFETQSVGNLILHSQNADFTGGDIKHAEIDFDSGNFRARDIDELLINSKSAKVVTGNVKQAKIESTDDDYDLDEVGVLKGLKSYNTLRIEKLIHGLDIKGINADIKIRNIDPAADSVKVTDKYCDMRLSLSGLKNYRVNYEGIYGKVYAGFEKKPLPITEYHDIDVDKPSEPVKELTTNQTSPATQATSSTTAAKIKTNVTTTALRATAPTPKLIEVNPGEREERFTATGGTGKGPIVIVICQSCTVDFK